MNILVTGGAGYIGSILVPDLLKEGHEVTVVDNFMYNQNSLLDCCNNKNLTIIRGDVRNVPLIKECLNNKQIIIPLAAYVGAPLCDEREFGAHETNSLAIADLCYFKKPHQSIIFPTTNSGYGIGQEGIYCTEDTPLNPISFYGKLKVQAEKEITRNDNNISLRLATVFGISPRMRTDLLVNDFVYRAVNDKYVVLYQPHFKRNYIHVRDVSKAFIHCINNLNHMKGNVYNVGLNNANLSKAELCEEIKKEIPDFYFTESNIGEDIDKRNYIVSNTKIQGTDFEAKISLREGIKELIKGYQIIRKNHYSNI